MRRATVVLLIFLLIVGGIIGSSLVLRNQPPLEFTIAVHPLAAEWVREAVNDFNASEPLVNSTRRVRANIITIEDLDVWLDAPNWTRTNHPAGWIPASSASVTYTNSTIPFEIIQPSLARSPLVWGGYASRVNVLLQDGATLDWGVVQQAAARESWAEIGGEADWRFIKLAFPLPNSDISGLAVLLSGAGSYYEREQLDRSALTDSAFLDWMRPIFDAVPNFQSLGGNVAQGFARGPSTAEIGILPEAQWLLQLNGILSNETVVFHYPRYNFVLDFPLAVWADPTAPLSDDERAAVAAFGEYLRTSAQGRVTAYGLRPAEGEPQTGDALFGAALPYGIALEPDYGIAVQAPQRQTAETLIQQFR